MSQPEQGQCFWIIAKGYGTEALRILMQYLFEEFNLNRISISARANNPRAIRAYQKVGFKIEGIARKDDYFNGEFVDSVLLGVLRKEFAS
ncbi:hypothetical protein CL633_00910 [bacterium]|nr:hypothetical protein [bacterium]|tara:strand:- start:1455 stop:1724 length:270 start_codon:yes stop_codon:yes gene_type:complete